MLQEVAQEVKNTVTEILQGVHTAIPGKIVKFYPDKCEAEILPYGKWKKPSGEYIDFPQLNHAPIYFAQSMGQTATIVYPIEPGDECLILAQEQTLDIWRNAGAESDNDLRFDLTNTIAIVGLFSKPNPLVQRSQNNKSIIIQREDTFVEVYDGKIETLVRHKDTSVDSYHLVVDAEQDTLQLKIKSNDDEKETIKIDIDGNEGKINLVTTNTEHDTETIGAELYGQKGTISVKTNHIENKKETLQLDINGDEGTVNFISKNYDTEKETSEINVDSQAGIIDLIAKNKETGNETAHIKMDGVLKTIDIQGYVTIKGSFIPISMEIPD